MGETRPEAAPAKLVEGRDPRGPVADAASGTPKPGGTVGGRHHEQDVPARTPIEGSAVGAELVADRRQVLVALVDLEAHGRRAVVGRDDDDGVGGGTRWQDVERRSTRAAIAAGRA